MNHLDKFLFFEMVGQLSLSPKGMIKSSWLSMFDNLLERSIKMRSISINILYNLTGRTVVFKSQRVPVPSTCNHVWLTHVG